MRGCLSFLLFVVVLVGLLAWFVLPAVAGPLVVASLTGAGLDGRDTRATVTANPPLELLLLRADRVRVQSSDVALRGIRAASLDISLTDVSFLDRSFASIDGDLGGLTVTTAAGASVEIPSIHISGSSSTARADFVVPSSLVVSLAQDAAERATGRRPSAVTLKSPDVVSFDVGGATLDETLAIDGWGDLIAEGSGGAAGLPSLVLVRATEIAPFALDSVSVVDAGVRLGGTVDLAAMGL